MDALDQTVHVLDLSSKVTVNELNTFFSYCGTVDKVQMVRNRDESQMAYVTFRHPYALQTALLLNVSDYAYLLNKGAIVGDRPIRVFRLQTSVDIPISEENIDGPQKKQRQGGLVSGAEYVVQALALEGYEAFWRAKEKVELKYKKLSEKGKVVTQQTTEQMRSAITSDNHFSAAGALFLSGVKDVLHSAGKFAADLGNSNSKRSKPNSRKQK